MNFVAFKLASDASRMKESSADLFEVFRRRSMMDVSFFVPLWAAAATDGRELMQFLWIDGVGRRLSWDTQIKAARP